MEECTRGQHVYGEALGMLTQNLLQTRRGLKLIFGYKILDVRSVGGQSYLERSTEEETNRDLRAKDSNLMVYSASPRWEQIRRLESSQNQREDVIFD